MDLTKSHAIVLIPKWRWKKGSMMGLSQYQEYDLQLFSASTTIFAGGYTISAATTMGLPWESPGLFVSGTYGSMSVETIFKLR